MRYRQVSREWIKCWRDSHIVVSLKHSATLARRRLTEITDHMWNPTRSAVSSVVFKKLLVWFDLLLYVPVNFYAVMSDWSSWVEPVLSNDQGHNAVTPVRLEPTTPRYRDTWVNVFRISEFRILRLTFKMLNWKNYSSFSCLYTDCLKTICPFKLEIVKI